MESIKSIIDYIKSIEDIELYLILFLIFFIIWFIFNTIAYHKGQKRKVKNLHRFAQKGEVKAQSDLAKHYHKGKVVKKNLDSAAFWYQKAYFAGDKKAKSVLDKFIYKKKG